MFAGPNRHSKGCGTGILISPNLVLTAAHNLYCKNSDTLNISIDFFYGVNGEIDKRKAYAVIDCYLPWKFLAQPNKAMNDFALLKL